MTLRERSPWFTSYAKVFLSAQKGMTQPAALYGKYKTLRLKGRIYLNFSKAMGDKAIYFRELKPEFLDFGEIITRLLLLFFFKVESKDIMINVSWYIPPTSILLYVNSLLCSHFSPCSFFPPSLLLLSNHPVFLPVFKVKLAVVLQTLHGAIRYAKCLQ